MTPDELLRKAARAVTSGELLFAAEDFDGAANRAYYAMFHAAKAGLRLAGVSEELAEGKTHNGLHAIFNLQLVKTGRVPRPLGASFRQAEALRRVSDYVGDPIDKDAARNALDWAAAFLAAMRALG